MRSVRPVGIVVLCVIAIALVGAWKACGHSGAHKNAAHSGSGAQSANGITARLNKDGPVEPASISGRVTRAQDGAPVPNATVSLAPAELMAMFIKADMPTLIATTDANGNWKAARVMPGAYVAAATASGYLPNSHAKLTVQQGEQRTGIDIVLTMGGTIVKGTVSDVGGGAIGDARITANKGDDIPDLSGHADFVTVTKPDGTYEITLPDGDFRLEATHDDYTSSSHHLEVAGKPLTQDFTLIPGAVVRGTVVARDSGKPVPGALVRADGGQRGGGGGDDGATAIADNDGNFTLRSLGSGTLELRALGRGYASSQPTVVNVGIGEQQDGVRVMVDKAYSIRGRVVQKGKPDKGIPGITLGAFSIAAKSFGLAIEPSGTDGSFEIYGVKPATYMLFAVGEGTVPEVGKNVEVVDKDVEGVIVEMSAGVTVSGVVSPPMASAQVTVAMQGEIGIANMFDAAKLMLVRGVTDSGGAFTLKNVPAGSFKLTAQAPDGHTGEEPVVVADTDKAGVTIKLEPRASVSGRVTDSNGQPVAGGKVYVDSLDDDDKKMRFSFNDMRRDNATTGPDGSYKVVGLEAGKVRVRASDGIGNDFYFMAKKDQPAKSAAEITLVAAQETKNVNLQIDARDGVIKGQVQMPDGKPAPDAWVSAHKARDKDPTAGGKDNPDFEGWMGPAHPPVLTDSAGNFTITKLRKGSYNLMVDGPKGTSHAEQNGVKTGDTVTIKLLALGTLTGKVTLAGAPVTSYDIECRGPHYDNSEQHIDAKDGAYELDRLTPGAYTCSVDAPMASGSGKVTVPAGPMTLDIALTRFASVSGTVVSVLDKKPIAGVTVFAGNDANMTSANFDQMIQGTAPKTDANGKFVVNRVPTGKGKVAVMPKDGFMPLGQRDYTVNEGQSIDVGVIEVVPPRQGEAGTFGMSTSPIPSMAGSGAGSGSAAFDNNAILVSSVKDGGPASVGGVREGDKITAINGSPVSTLTPMIASQLLASGSVGVGETVTLTIDRGGQAAAATLTSIKW